tara:strand:- start:8998 stop:9378 length:381 start_codon:yes stop_codon:yes gene_type:complete
MVTYNQLNKKCRKKKLKQNFTPALKLSPQKKGMCLKVFTTNPKKPNSAIRKVCRVKLSNKMIVTASIPGQGHKLQKFSIVLIRGGRSKDLPGVRYKLIRGKYDLNVKETFERKNARSKYGYKKNKK